MVQVNGKVRDRIQVPAGIDEARAKELAQASPLVQKHIEGRGDQAGDLCAGETRKHRR